jgi:PAS domain S-box-containing protein
MGLQYEKSNNPPTNRATDAFREFQPIASSLDLGLWLYDVTAQYLEWDTSVYRRYGVSRETFPTPGEFWNQCLTEESLDRALKEMQLVLEEKKNEYHAVYELKLPGGETRHVLARASVIRDETGRPKHIYGINLDVTEHRKIEIENQQLVERLREAQALARIGSWTFDLATQDLQWSTELYRIYEFAENIPAGKLYEQMRNRIPPEELRMLDELIERACLTGEGYAINHRLLFDKGRVKHVQGIGHAAKDSDGKIVRIFGTCRDQTKEFLLQKELEEERAKSNRNARLASLGELSAGVAHEINNPLAIIDGNARLLAGCANNAAAFSIGIQTILNSCSRISRIVTSLKKFAGVSEPTPHAEHSVHDVINETLELIETKARSSCAEISLELNADTWIRCDRLQIEQVLINLVNNAADAIATEQEKWIKISTAEIDGMAVIRVSNSGSRISKEIQEKLFTPFFTTKGIGEGTGLGLSISKGIVDDHGGSIAFVEDSPNTCFEFRLPKIKLNG